MFFSLYKELALKIEANLTCGRKSSPTIKIEMPFDKLLYDGGLKSLGRFKHRSRGNKQFTITTHSDLDPLLGKNWHVRGLNIAGDFSCIIPESVCYYLRRKRPLVEYIPDSCAGVVKQLQEQGYTLVFTFVVGYGVSSDFCTVYVS